MPAINYWFIIIVFCVSLVVSVLLTPLMKNIAQRFGILSKPDKRRVHLKPIPYLGGVAIYFAFVIGIIAALYLNPQIKMEFSRKIKGLLIGGTLIMILGLWDDIKNLRASAKLIGQILVALLLFGYKFRIEIITNPFGGEVIIPLFWSALITIVWIVAIINALNLIDGLDGLAAGITFIGTVALFLIALSLKNYATVLLLAALTGSALGFLKFNFYPAKIFMGDAGSMFLGFCLASLVLINLQYKAATAVAFLIPIIALAIPIYDTIMAMVRRILKKRPIFMADKKHLHHRLLSMGLSHKHVVLFLYFASVYFGIIAFLFNLIAKEYAFVLLILLGMGLFIGVRTIGFIERKVRALESMEKMLNNNNRNEKK